MLTLGIDIGSSSVKAGVLRGTSIVGKLSRSPFKTRYDGVIAEVDARDVVSAVRRCIADLGTRVKRVDCVALSVMAPSWVAMDAKGRAITPVVTHQDRRSVRIALEIEQRVGKSRHLRIAGNRPFPGGISSTTCAYFLKHNPGLKTRIATVGHLNTFLIRQITGECVTDPSNASFMGLYETCKLGGWSDELCDAVGVKPQWLPRIVESNHIAGRTNGEWDLPRGVPVLAGCMDTSAAMFLAGAKAGQLLNVCGSTDVLAMCVDRPSPHLNLLTRALGVGRKWMSVSTLAAAGSAIDWARRTMFSEMSEATFHRTLARAMKSQAGSVEIEPWFAGSRTSMDLLSASIGQLSLGTTREEILAAMVRSLAKLSADRISLLQSINDISVSTHVFVSGGVSAGLGKVMHAEWGARWKFNAHEEATLRGLGALAMSV